MDKLYPIIRRKRRPLYVEDVPPISSKTKPVQSVAKKPAVEPAKISKPDDAESPATNAAP
jgi:hypothetical protein